MKKFKFVFQAMLDLKISLENQEKRELAAVSREIEGNKENLNNLLKKLEQAYDIYNSCALRGTYAAELGRCKRSIDYINDGIYIVRTTIRELEAKRDTIRQKLLVLMKERKMLEKLKEQKYKSYIAEMKIENNKDLEEITGRMVVFKGNANG